jgi:hypothetical protein
MFRGFVAGVLATIVVALVGGYIVLRSGLIPTNADAKPGWLETWAANTSLQATVAREAPKGPNPVALMDENLIDGIDLYGQHCAICHGTAKGGVALRVFIPSRARGTDTLVRREPRISAEIPSSDVQNWVRMSCARRKTACDVLEAARGRFVQTTENPSASPGISKLNPRRRSHSLFTNRRCSAALPVRSTPYPRRQALPLARARG